MNLLISMISVQWSCPVGKKFLDRASEVFKKGPSEDAKELEEKKENISALEQKIGQLPMR